jgi:alkanesulfonate monooxygenase SsuD/methylene tetrahydromethanopterin reductase-like flavin-dependent oxidoreductase (luciferase family)
MKSWYFSEQSYWPAWSQLPDNPKITAPSGIVDPEVASQLLHEYLEQCDLCDELGLNIMVNEHHASYTCMSVSCMLTLGILASRTKRARLLALGVPIMGRMEPHRVAEEIAWKWG